MIRDFVAGILLGGVVAGAGLGIVSHLAPIERTQLGKPTVLAATEHALAPQEEAGAGAAGNADSSQAEFPAVKAELQAEPAGGAEPKVEPKAESGAVADAAPAKPTLPEDALVAAVPEADPSAVSAMPTPTVDPAALPVADAPAGAMAADPVPQTSPTAPMAETATANPLLQPAEEMPLLESPEVEGPEVEGPEVEAPAVQAPAVEPPAVILPTQDVPPADQAPFKKAELPSPVTQPNPATPLKPVTGLDEKVVEGVTQGRLPSIGSPPETGLADAKPANDAAEEALPSALPPITRFAQPFQNPAAKPLFAILLMDPGTSDVPRADLAALPFPVTFVIDPMSDSAASASEIYRAAGQEVVMLATGIPKGATASDLEQSFAKLSETLPESVGLLDTADSTFQNDRGLAADVVRSLADQGRGVITFDRGLNAADQVARREAVPSATIFRSLDDDGEDAPLIRRYLDRAAFKAAQEGKVVVIGTARPDTIAALMEWAVEGRAASVALAPITAVMATK